jgi:hypothetical protein
MWTQFKSHFLKADKDRRDNQTTGIAGFRAANAATLAVNTSVGGDTPSHTSTAASNDTDSIVSALTAATAANTEQIQLMMAALQTKTTTASTVSGSTPKTYRTGPRQKSYCWSHGVTTNLDHSSATCKDKKEGHQIDATASNRKGGSDFINGKDPNRNP